jgi:hypothetical protein
MHDAANVHTVDIHNLHYRNNGRISEVPALAAKSTEQVSDIYIRHYRNWLRHTCKLTLSPSILSLNPSSNAHAAAVAGLKIYVTFGACSKFKVYYNGKLFLQPDASHLWWKLYGAYVTVSRGGTFSIVLESCSEQKQFIGCFGSQVCTGFGDGDGWMCTRRQPPDGWMIPGFQAESPKLTDASRSQPRCNNVSDEGSIWSTFSDDARDHQCLGLSAFPAATDIVSCARACCSDTTCSRFQWCNSSGHETCSHPRCWLGTSMDCSRRVPGFVNGLLRSAAASTSAEGWERAVPVGSRLTFRSLEIGGDGRARWLWPQPHILSVEPQMFCRWSIR